jgi:hypothetical protein
LAKVDPLMQVGLFQVWQNVGAPTPARTGIQGVIGRTIQVLREIAGREAVHPIMPCMKGNADLSEIVATANSLSGLTGLLNGWKQQPDQYGDDGNDYQQLNQRETAPACHESILRDAIRLIKHNN